MVELRTFLVIFVLLYDRILDRRPILICLANRQVAGLYLYHVLSYDYMNCNSQTVAFRVCVCVCLYM
jgi:hypothetical protein